MLAGKGKGQPTSENMLAGKRKGQPGKSDGGQSVELPGFHSSLGRGNTPRQTGVRLEGIFHIILHIILHVIIHVNLVDGVAHH